MGLVLLNLFLVFAKIGAFSFGGGYAMIPFIREEVIESQGWLTVNEMVDILAISQMTPGPIAVNLATFIGYETQGVFGAVAATTGVIFPSLVIITTLAAFFFKHKENEKLKWVMAGIRPVVVSLVLMAAFLVLDSAIQDYKGGLIAIAAFGLILKFKLHPIIVIFSAGLIGILIF